MRWSTALMRPAITERFRRIPAAIREGAVYAAAIGIARITGVLLLPLLTRRLSDPELGVFGLLTSILLLVQYGAGLGLDSGATRWFYEAELAGSTAQATQADRRRTLSAWVWSTMAMSAAASALGAFAAAPLARMLFDGTASEIRATRAAALTIPGLAMVNVLQHWYRMVRRPMPALAVAVIVAGATLVLTIGLVGIGNAGVGGVFAAQAIAGAAVTVAGLVVLWPTIGAPRIDSERLRAMLRYSLPLLPAVASPLLLGLLTRVLIRVFSDVGEVGKFQVVAMLATVVTLVTTAFQQAWEPYALSMTDREAAKPIYRAAFVGFAAVAGLVSVCLAAGFPLALPILGSRFGDLALPAVVFGASMLISGGLPIVNTGPSIAGTGRPALETMLVGTLMNVAFCAALVPSFGQLGACWASLITAVLLVAFGTIRSERVWRIDFPVRATTTAALVSSLVCAALLAFTTADGLSLALRIVVALVIMATSVAVCTRVLLRVGGSLRTVDP